MTLNIHTIEWAAVVVVSVGGVFLFAAKTRTFASHMLVFTPLLAVLFPLAFLAMGDRLWFSLGTGIISPFLAAAMWLRAWVSDDYFRRNRASRDG